jgi:hypothetical protein
MEHETGTVIESNDAAQSPLGALRWIGDVLVRMFQEGGAMEQRIEMRKTQL